MSSSRPYNFPPSESWSPGHRHDSTSHGPEHSYWNRWQPIFPHPQPSPEIPQNTRRVDHDPWLPATERPRPVRSGINSFRYPAQTPPRPPNPPVRVLVHHDDIPRHASYPGGPRPSQLPFDSPPPWFLQNQQPNMDESKLSPDEQTAALSKLKKEIYNPVQTKVSRQVSLYFRGLNNNINNTTSQTKKDKDEDGKRCAICLEDFVAKEMVTVTPCSHMFHEECVVPWVISHGSCPVCRFAICERMKHNADSSARTAANTMPHDLMVERDLISIMRAFDETLELDNIRSILLPRLTRG